MKSVKETELCTRVVTDVQEIERLRHFQHRRYAHAGLLSQPDGGLPPDPLVERSAYFGVYDADKVVATARIVRSGTLPMLDHHTFFPDFSDRFMLEGDSVGEISRLAVAPDTPPYVALALLSREFLRFGLNNPDASLLVASVERPLVRILDQILGIPLHLIGDEISSYGSFNGACVPILLDTNECLRSFAAGNGRQWKFFTEDLIIDLTEPASQQATASV